MMERGIVLRCGELFLKGKNRPMFEKALERRIARLASRFGAFEIRRGQGRFFVTGGAPSGLVDALSEVFGIASLSVVQYVEKDLDAMTSTAVAMASEGAAEGARTFRIRARRSDKRFELGSPEINRRVGSAVVEATGLEVDLERPDLTIGVEVSPQQTFLWSRVIQGPGGLPVGVAGLAALLLSGGIDSPVAGHLMQKRGLRLFGVHFHSAPWTSAASQEKVRLLARRLAERQGSLELIMVPFGQFQEAVRDRVDEGYRVILYRRTMLRIAQRLAEERDAKALVTGDSLGQVASQTVENLACIEDAADMLVLRPLLGFDKLEVIDVARRIGTYDLSIQPHDDCCSLFVPRHPQTRGRAKTARRQERRLDVEALVAQALSSATVEIIET